MVEDIDLGLADFISKTNADLVGKYANLASRSGPMLTRQLDGRLGTLDDEGRQLVGKLAEAKEQIIRDYEGLDYAAAVRTIGALADDANRYVEQKQPWATIKTDREKTRTTLTAVLNTVKILTDLSQADSAALRAEGGEVPEGRGVEFRRRREARWRTVRSVNLNDCSRELTRSR